jgi:hypothetical protein
VVDAGVFTGGGVSLAMNGNLYLIGRLDDDDATDEVACVIEYDRVSKANHAALGIEWGWNLSASLAGGLQVHGVQPFVRLPDAVDAPGAWAGEHEIEKYETKKGVQTPIIEQRIEAEWRSNFEICHGHLTRHDERSLAGEQSH